MHPDLSVAACPGCGALVRPGAPWCTQCFRGLVEQPPGLAAPAAGRVAGPARAPDSAASTLPDGAPAWPCSGCGTATPMSDDTCSGCGLGFLAQVRSEERPLLVLPGLGDVSRRSRGQLAAAACGAVLLVVLLFLLLFLLVA